MRNNLFELMKGNEINLHNEFFRLYKVFEKTEFGYEHSIKKFINNNCFLNWKYRKRYISIDDLICSLKLDWDDMSEINITNNKLLLYAELIFNLISLVERHTLDIEDLNILESLRNNILDLLEDMNYEIKSNKNSQFFIVEKDKFSSAIAEKFPNLTNTVIEYRRFALKGNLESKKNIILSLSEYIEPLRKKLNGTNYKNIIDDINMLLNNVHIRHNNLEGKYRQEYTVNMSKEELETWYDTTYDLILSALMLEDYVDKQKSIDELKTHY